MRAKDIIQFFIKENGTWIDYTDGTLSINGVRGVSEYIGSWQQSDAGQMVITSRNPDLDPYSNQYIRANKEMRITANEIPIFTGKISNIDVEYRPQGEPPIITLTGFDFLATLQQTILTDAFVKMRPQNWGLFSLLQDLETYNTEIPGFVNGNRVLATGGSTGINTGTACYDAMTLFGPPSSYNPPNVHPSTLPSKASFDSRGTALNYKAINLNDGFERIVNQIEFTNAIGQWVAPGYTVFNSTVTRQPTEENTFSKELWGAKRLSLTTASSIANFPDLANKIFIESANPQREISSITWDATTNPEIAKDLEIFDNINIYHETYGLVIDRKYSIVGISHEITESEWLVTYALRNFDYVETSMPDPYVIVDETSADTNYFFNFSVGFPADEIQSVLWNFGDGTTSTDLTPTKKYSTTGTKNVTVKVTNVFGWYKTSEIQQIVVVGAVPTNTWTYVVSPSSWNTVTFDFTGFGATSYAWNFGDGGTSNLENPVHVYAAAGTYTVTCVATNSFGSSTTSHPVTVTAPVNPGDETGTFPIRYLKIEQPLVTEGYPNPGPTQMWNNLSFLKAKTSSGVNLALNRPVINVTNTKGYLTDLVYIGTISTPCYVSYQKYQDWNYSLQPLRLTTDITSTASSGIRPEIDTDSGDCGKSEWSVIVDLQANYNTIDEIVISGTWSGPSFTKPILSVYGSSDNITYTKIGEFNVNGLPLADSRTAVTMIPTGAMPPNL
jgi:PKD repeat protein